MRSIQYVLGGKPRNLDDCLDLSLKEKPIVVSLDLGTQERATEEYILKQFIGRFNWKFANKSIEYEDIFGGVFFHEDEKRQKRSIDNANRRLEISLRKIEDSGIDIIGKEKRFDYSLTYVH